MPSCLVHTGDESVPLSAATVKRLLDRGDGDAALLYLALLSAVAYSLWAVLLRVNPVSRVAVYTFLQPIFGVILSLLLVDRNSAASALRGGAGDDLREHRGGQPRAAAGGGQNFGIGVKRKGLT